MNTTLYVGNIPVSMSASQLEDMFTLIGDVRSAQIMCDDGSAINNGRGYVEMATEQEAENGVLHFNGQFVNGKTLMVRLLKGPR